MAGKNRHYVLPGLRSISLQLISPAQSFPVKLKSVETAKNDDIGRPACIIQLKRNVVGHAALDQVKTVSQRGVPG